MSLLNVNKNAANNGLLQRLIDFIAVNFWSTDKDIKLYNTLERQLNNNIRRIVLKSSDFKHDKRLFTEMSKLSKKELALLIKEAIEYVFKQDLNGYDVEIVK